MGFWYTGHKTIPCYISNNRYFCVFDNILRGICRMGTQAVVL